MPLIRSGMYLHIYVSEFENMKDIISSIWDYRLDISWYNI